MKNYYATLEVPVGASLEEIRQSYRRLVQEHLDDEAVFADLKEAYEVLSTPTRRAEYDQSVWGGAFESAPASAAAGSQEKRCPLAAGAACPVLQGQALTGAYCPECGFALVGLDSGTAFDAALPHSAKAWLEGRGGETYSLRPGPNTVGRDSGDVLVADKTVSRSHARLELGEGGSLTVEDLGSTNGTQVNDVLLTPQVPRSLSDGDRVRFGSVSLTLHLRGAEDAVQGESGQEVPAAAGMEDAAATAARAQVVEIGTGDGRAFPLAIGPDNIWTPPGKHGGFVGRSVCIGQSRTDFRRRRRRVYFDRHRQHERHAFERPAAADTNAVHAGQRRRDTDWRNGAAL